MHWRVYNWPRGRILTEERKPQAKWISEAGMREYSGSQQGDTITDFEFFISHGSKCQPLGRICLGRRKGKTFFSLSACFYLPLEDSGVILRPRKWPEARRIWAQEDSSVTCRNSSGQLTLSCHRHKSPGCKKDFTPSSKKGYLFATQVLFTSEVWKFPSFSLRAL